MARTVCTLALVAFLVLLGAGRVAAQAEQLPYYPTPAVTSYSPPAVYAPAVPYYYAPPVAAYYRPAVSVVVAPPSW